MPKGALVGVFSGLRYAATEVELEADAVLVCFTDGVTEAQSLAGDQFSEGRLLSIAADRSSGSVEDLLDAVQRELSLFLGGTPPADDCTLLAVRRPAKQ
jgi:sigma-B regulation protein RsbU (phosphoserine phosphatase)